MKTDKVAGNCARIRGAASSGLLLLGLALGSVAAVAQAAPPAKLTASELGRLQIIALQQGSTIPLPPALLDVLHLSPAQVAPSVRQVSFQQDDGVKHGFARLNDGTGYFLFRRSADAGLSAYHVDASFNLVAGAHNFGPNRFMALPPNTALKEVGDEALAWSQVLLPKAAPAATPATPAGAPAPAPTAPSAAPAAPAAPSTK